MTCTLPPVAAYLLNHYITTVSWAKDPIGWTIILIHSGHLTPPPSCAPWPRALYITSPNIRANWRRTQKPTAMCPPRVNPRERGAGLQIVLAPSQVPHRIRGHTMSAAACVPCVSKNLRIRFRVSSTAWLPHDASRCRRRARIQRRRAGGWPHAIGTDVRSIGSEPDPKMERVGQESPGERAHPGSKNRSKAGPCDRSRSGIHPSMRSIGRFCYKNDAPSLHSPLPLAKGGFTSGVPASGTANSGHVRLILNPLWMPVPAVPDVLREPARPRCLGTSATAWHWAANDAARWFMLLAVRPQRYSNLNENNHSTRRRSR